MQTQTSKATAVAQAENKVSHQDYDHSPQEAMPQLSYGSNSLLQRQEHTDNPPSAPAPNNSAPQQHINPHGVNGLPENIKFGIESLSGMSLDSVKVFYNSSKPAQVNADAYAQGNQIHLGSGQEHHLPHEAWHVVQQAQGRVAQTIQFAGHAINDDPSLEQEADDMGHLALKLGNRLIDSAEKALTGSTMPQSSPDPLEHQVESQVGSQINNPVHALGINSSAVRQLSVQTGIIQCSFKSEYETAFRAAGEDYEEDLGLYTYNLPQSIGAADDALDALKGIMNINDDDGYGANFGVDDVRSAGAVGTVAATVRDAVDNGNLREKMTAFYNASLGPFKALLEDAWEHDTVNDLAVNDVGKANIRARKNNIDSLPDKYKYKAMPKSWQKKLKDVYVAPADPFFRQAGDHLTRGQTSVFSPEARTRKIESDSDAELNALNLSHLQNFDFANNLIADIQHDGLARNLFRTSIFADVKTALQAFNAENGDQAAKVKKFRTLRNHVWKWLAANKRGGTEEEQNVYDQQLANNDTKAQKIAGVANALKKHMAMTLLNKELGKIMSISRRRPAALRNARSAFNADLSNREQAFIGAQEHGGVFDNNRTLPWAEGGSLFSTTTKNAWAKEAQNVLMMPVRSGPSGTTDRMFQATDYLGLTGMDFKLNFRLALLGWMLTSNDHSYHEIMGVSKTYNLPYEPGLTGYNQVAPLTEENLRVNACLYPNYQHLFPDEVAYYRTIDNQHSHLLSPFRASLAAKAASNPLALQERGGMAANQYNEAGLPFINRSITAYTATPVVFINQFLKRPNTARLIYYSLLSNPDNDRYAPRDSWGKKAARRIKQDFPGATAGSVMEEMPYHVNFLQRAWQKLPAYNGISWRGGGAGHLYRVGETFSPPEYWSSTKKANPMNTVRAYAAGAGGKVKMIFRINGHNGKIVNGVSINERDNARNLHVNPGVDEVLFAPNTSFIVTNVINVGEPGGDNTYPVVEVDEQ